ncbi:hypothetical protein K439DRAFT_1637155 [Ramaria rubella]|nr:hypothetical protein K439DRAFT_1637155 [Ramaria rubella]
MTTNVVNPCQWIYLNGYAGVGKLSIARELTKLIPGSKVIDNHLIIDLCRSVFQQGSEEYESLRRQVRQELFTAMSRSEVARQTTYVFTGSHLKHNPTAGPLVARDYERHANSAKIPFISVILVCEEEEHFRRAMSLSRQGGDGVPGKLTNIDTLKAIREMEIFKFHCRHEMEALDVTELTAVEAAKRIKDFVDTVDA